MIPAVYRGFGEINTAAMTSGALDRKIKELIGLAIGVVHRYDAADGEYAWRRR